MPKTPEQYEKIRLKSKLSIEDAALKCFAENGVFNTTMAKIAKQANVSVGLAYNYYKSKDELLVTIILNGMRRFSATIEGKSMLEKSDVKQFMDNFFDGLTENPDAWKLYLMVLVQPDVMIKHKDELLKITVPFQKAFYAYFKSIGSKKPEVETAFFYSVIDGVFMDYVTSPEQYPIEEIKQKIYKLYDL